MLHTTGDGEDNLHYPNFVLPPAPFAPQQHREAVMILSGMMLTWLRNQ